MPQEKASSKHASKLELESVTYLNLTSTIKQVLFQTGPAYDDAKTCIYGQGLFTLVFRDL